MKRNCLFSNTMERFQWRCHIQLEDVGTLVFQVCEFCKRTTASGSDDFIPTIQSSYRQVTSETRPKYDYSKMDDMIHGGKSTYEVPVMSQTSCLDMIVL